MYQWRTRRKRWQRTSLIIVLSLFTVGTTIFILWSNAQAGYFAGGPGNCGNFDQAVRLSQDGDIVVQMAQPRSSGDAFITENLRISGGWAPTQNCDDNNQYFTTTADYLAWGFAYTPTNQTELFAFDRSVLTIENPISSEFPRIDRLVIENMIFNVDGTAPNGGGIIGVISNTAHHLYENNIFRGNDVSNDGGGLNLEIWDHSSLLIADSAFITNTAVNFGGGFNVELQTGSKLTIENSQFAQNEALFGAGFAAYVAPDSELLIRNSIFTDNRNTFFNGTGAGGHIVVNDGYVSIVNSAFLFNDAGDNGGGLHIEMNGGDVIIKNGRFEGNSADNGGGALYVESVGDEDADIWIINSQFEGNTPANFQFSQTGSGSLTTHILDHAAYLPAIFNNMATDVRKAKIISLTLDADFNYNVYFETENFEPNTSSYHVHFFFDTVQPEYAGTELCPFPSDPTQCKWKLYGGSSPFTGYSFGDRPFDAFGAEEMCVLVADAQHRVLLNTGNCIKLP